MSQICMATIKSATNICSLIFNLKCFFKFGCSEPPSGFENESDKLTLFEVLTSTPLFMKQHQENRDMDFEDILWEISAEHVGCGNDGLIITCFVQKRLECLMVFVKQWGIVKQGKEVLLANSKHCYSKSATLQLVLETILTISPAKVDGITATLLRELHADMNGQV